MKTGIIYARSAVETGTNTKDQIVTCMAEAFKQDIEVMDTFIDVGIGARLQPQLGLAMDLIAAGNIKFLIVTDSSRISRNSSLFLKVTKMLKNAKCELIVASEEASDLAERLKNI